MFVVSTVVLEDSRYGRGDGGAKHVQNHPTQLNPVSLSKEVHLLRIFRTFKNKSARNVQIE